MNKIGAVYIDAGWRQNATHKTAASRYTFFFLLPVMNCVIAE